MKKIQPIALTFDDVLIVPNHSTVLPKATDISTQLTSNIKLRTPLLSAAMDTVTESKLAIAIAQEGGLGIIHKNISADDQAREVSKVKRHESNIIRNPVTVDANASIADVLNLQKQYGISALPVLKDGQLRGLITSRDIRFQENLASLVKDNMTPKNKLITVRQNIELSKIKALLHRYRIERVLVVDNSFKLNGMITVKDIERSSHYPNASKDKLERLLVGAAVGVGSGTSARIAGLVNAGVDVIVIDTAHGHSQQVIDRVIKTKKQYPKLDIIAGNIATADAAKALAKAGVDAVKVGIGPGSICTTRIVAGVGMPQISAIINVANALVKTKVGVIADGGIRYSGDIAKAFVAGANAVMIGSLFAGTEEAPGEIELYKGRSYKSYRGMGSISAMEQVYGSSDRYFQIDKQADKLVPEGVEGRVPFKGALRAIVHQMIGGVRAMMGYAGCKSLSQMHIKAQFVQITNAGMVESHVHDVSITKEAPNYHK